MSAHQHPALLVHQMDQARASATGTIDNARHRLNELQAEGHTEDEAMLHVISEFLGDIAQMLACGMTPAGTVAWTFVEACRKLNTAGAPLGPKQTPGL